MNVGLHRWKRYLAWGAMALVLPLLMAACGGDDDKITIKIWDGEAGLGSQSVASGVFEFIIENGYDYPVEVVEVTTPVAQATLATGEIHLFVEGWQQNFPEWYDDNIADGNIVNLGENLEGGPQFFVIPQWVHEQYGIDTVFDMKDNWELFKDPEDSSKGVFYNCIIGWQCAEFNTVKLGAYGLDGVYNDVKPGSAGALKAVLAAGQIKEEPVFGYYWSPTSLMGAYDWYILEEPEYTDACWDIVAPAQLDPSLRPVSEACAYPNPTLDFLGWSGLDDEAPDVVELMRNSTLGLAAVQLVLAWAEENEIDDRVGEGGLYFIQNNLDLVKSWMPAENWDKVKAALDEAS